MSGPQPPLPPSGGASNPRSTPTTDVLLEPLARLQTLSQTLFASLAPAHAKPPAPPPAAAFLACDAQLADAVALARAHQVRQRRIEALKREILALDARWREICAGLEEGKRGLEAIVEEGETRMKAMQKAKEGAYLAALSAGWRELILEWAWPVSVPYPELLAYAQTISAFTSAPPNMPDLAPGQPPPPLFFPPFPNEEKMRRGRLNAEAPLGILGETHSVGRRKSVSSVAL
jgi:mediator of RNA polymerase II transcription subunit 4